MSVFKGPSLICKDCSTYFNSFVRRSHSGYIRTFDVLEYLDRTCIYLRELASVEVVVNLFICDFVTLVGFSLVDHTVMFQAISVKNVKFCFHGIEISGSRYALILVTYPVSLIVPFSIKSPFRYCREHNCSHSGIRHYIACTCFVRPRVYGFKNCTCFFFRWGCEKGCCTWLVCLVDAYPSASYSCLERISIWHPVPYCLYVVPVVPP